MVKNKIKLYHYSEIDIPDKIKVKTFGKNYYTKNDISACNIKRSFYYIGKGKAEHLVKHSTYVYVAEVNKKQLYNLDIDKNKLKEKFIRKNLDIVDIPKMLRYIKKRYIGTIYNENMVTVFKDLQYNKKIKRGRLN